jgi:butyrate kinase
MIEIGARAMLCFDRAKYCSLHHSLSMRAQLCVLGEHRVNGHKSYPNGGHGGNPHTLPTWQHISSMRIQRILTINPGSTSTKVVLFHGMEPMLSSEVRHPPEELKAYPDIWSQLAPRLETILNFLAQGDHGHHVLDAVVGRGGLLAPLPGGVYRINDRMLEDLRLGTYGEHPCNLGAPLAREIARRFGGQAMITDPVVTDELCAEARWTGLPQIRRRSIFHALSQRGAAREAARRRGMGYKQGKFIVAHLGGGMSIGAHLRGQVVDVTNALDGEGPMTPERAGALPVLGVLDLLERGVFDIPGLRQAVLRQGGLLAHLGSNDFQELEERIQADDAQVEQCARALVHAVAKHVASFLPVLVTMHDPNPLDAVVITGGLARSPWLQDQLGARLSPLAPLEIVLGMTEARIMAESGLAVLQGTTAMQGYPPSTVGR